MAVRRTVTSQKVGVCLLATHPIVLGEFHRLLSYEPFSVLPKKIQPRFTGPVEIPQAEVYVVDCEGNRATTETLLSRIFGLYANARVLLVGSAFDDQTAFPLLRLGVKGMLEHSQLALQLARALQSVATGGYWVPRTLLARFVDSLRRKTNPPALAGTPAALSRREMEVADALLGNLSNKEIGSKLKISERTVKFHVSNLLEKFGVRRRADLVVLFYQVARGANPLSNGVVFGDTRVN